jgi:hypothetical protein
MSETAKAEETAKAAEHHRSQVWLFLTSGLIIAAAAFFIGHYVGYRSGYQAAYVPEHSHYVFEQKRARAFQKRITDQRRCIDSHVRDIPSIDSGGFVGLGELFRNVGLLYAGTRICDGASGLGVPTQEQLKRIFPNSGN